MAILAPKPCDTDHSSDSGVPCLKPPDVNSGVAMPIKAICPSCGNEHQLADHYKFKTVECSQCATIFSTPESKGPPPLPPGFILPRAKNRTPDTISETPVPAGAPTVKAGPPPLPPKAMNIIPPKSETPAMIQFEVIPETSKPEPKSKPSEKQEKVSSDPAETPAPIQFEVVEEKSAKTTNESLGQSKSLKDRRKAKIDSESNTIPDGDLMNDDSGFKFNDSVENTEVSRSLDEDDLEVDEDRDPDDSDSVEIRKPARQQSKGIMLAGLAVVLLFVLGTVSSVLYFVLHDDTSSEANPIVASSENNGTPINPNSNVPKDLNTPSKVDPSIPIKKDEPKKEPEPLPKKEVLPEPPKKTETIPTPPSKVEPEPKKEPEKPKVDDGIHPTAVLVNPAGNPKPFDLFQKSVIPFDLATSGAIKEVCAAAGGKYLLVNCSIAKKLHIVDTGSASIVKTIPVTEDALVAGSMDHFVVVNPASKTIDRYLLETMVLENSSKINARQKIIAVGMGCRTNGPVVLGGPQSQNNASKMSLMFIDLPTLQEVKIITAEGDFRVGFGSAAQLRVSPNGRVLTAWFDKLNPSGMQVVQLAENSLRGTFLAKSVGSVMPSANGDVIYTEKGYYETGSLLPVVTGHFQPSVGGDWYMQMNLSKFDGEDRISKISVLSKSKQSQIASFENIPGFDGKKDPFQREVNQMPVDRRLWLIPESKVLITIPPSGDKLQFFPIPK